MKEYRVFFVDGASIGFKAQNFLLDSATTSVTFTDALEIVASFNTNNIAGFMEVKI